MNGCFVIKLRLHSNIWKATGEMKCTDSVYLFYLFLFLFIHLLVYLPINLFTYVLTYLLIN